MLVTMSIAADEGTQSRQGTTINVNHEKEMP